MLLAEHEGYLLEARAPVAGEYHNDLTWLCWVSNPERSVVGYGAGMSKTEAIDDAMRAWNTARKPIERALREKAR